MNALSTFGRIIFAIPFLVFGLMHLFNASQMAGIVPVPGGVFWVYLTGLTTIAAGISLITKIKIKLAATLLALQLFIYILLIHLTGVFNPQTMMMSMSSLLKDLGLMGGAIYIASTFSTEENT